MAKSLLKHCIFFTPDDTNQIVSEGFSYTFDSGTGSLKELYLWAKEMVLDWTYQAVVSTLLGRHKDEGFSLNFPEFLKDSLLLLRR